MSTVTTNIRRIRPSSFVSAIRQNIENIVHGGDLISLVDCVAETLKTDKVAHLTNERRVLVLLTNQRRVF